jgi:regulatory protein
VKIDDLVTDPRRPGSVRVMVGGRPAWTVPADVVAALGLSPGRPVRGETIDTLDRAAEEEGAFRAGLRAIERRAHGTRELVLKLERRGHDPMAVSAAMARLDRLGLLDDLAYARSYIEAHAPRGRGPARLRRDLAQRGVPREIIDRALGELAAGVDDPLAQPRALVARRARQLDGLPREARRRRLIAYLGRRGYRGAEMRQLVERALQS